jgi:Glycosyl transferases group 1
MNRKEDSDRTLIWALAYAADTRPSWEPFSAVRMYQSEIASRLSIDMQFHTTGNVQDAVAQIKGKKPDFMLVCPRWDTGCEETKYLIRALRTAADVKKTVFVDHCDATSTPYLPLLPDVDLFVKPHLFRDTRMYLQDYVGGHIFTDFLVKRLGWEIDGWRFGSCAKEEELGKLRVGWSYGVSRRIHALARFSSLLPIPWAYRNTDVNRRFRPVERVTQDWYERYRSMASKAVEQLGDRVKISGNERVKYKRYLVELMTSKIALSPFGWGEVCARDYEIVACGALLFKPDMNHVQTNPDIFIANETYIPLRWDFSDLADKVNYYISRPNEAKRIAIAGQQCLLKYFERRQFLDNFGSCMDGVNQV